MKGQLKTIVLNILSKKEMSGYSLIKKIKEDTGWKPSTGSIYPILDKFLKDGLVEVKKEERRKLYLITKEGKAKIGNIVEQRNKLIDTLISNFKIFNCIYEDEEIKKILRQTIGKLEKIR